jgi:hypothetical protein
MIGEAKDHRHLPRCRQLFYQGNRLLEAEVGVSSVLNYVNDFSDTDLD